MNSNKLKIKKYTVWYWALTGIKKVKTRAGQKSPKWLYEKGGRNIVKFELRERISKIWKNKESKHYR